MKRKCDSNSKDLKYKRFKNETLQQRENRLEKNRLRMRANRQKETYEEKELRLQKNREIYKKKLKNETNIQKSKRLQTMRIKKANNRKKENDHKKKTRLLIQRAKTALLKAKETINEKIKRLNKDKLKKRSSRMNESLKIKKKKVSKYALNMKKSESKRTLFREAFAYNSSIDYSIDERLVISEMIHLCSYCNALKFKNESPGMCCSNGKVNLPILNKPPEPLLSYVTGDSDVSKHFQQNIFKYNDIFKMTSFGATKILNRNCFLPTFKIQGI